VDHLFYADLGFWKSLSMSNYSSNARLTHYYRKNQRRSRLQFWIPNALSRHHGTDRASSNIADKVIGVVFLGTPFKCSSKAKWRSRALRLLDLVSMTRKEDTKDLEERSARLASINDAFQKYLKARDRSTSRDYIEVACFFEQYGMYIGPKMLFIVPRESACLPGVDAQSIQAHHTEMCKFEDEDREGYKSISQKLSQWISDFARWGEKSGSVNKVRHSCSWSAAN
jgi:protein SERAC1